MRLFELARELKTSNRDLISQAKALEVEVDSFIYVLDDADVTALRRGFKPRTSIEVADDEAAMNRALETKRQAAREALASAVAKESEVLAAATARARQALAEQEARRRGEPAAAPESPVAPPPAETPAEAPRAEAAPAPETPAIAPAAPVEAVAAVEPAIPAPVKPAAPAPERPPMPAGLEALPERPLQAPRPELVLKPVAPPPAAPNPAATAAKAPAAAATADAAKALKKEKKAPRALHPVDEEDEAAILPGSLSKVVRDTPARTAPARRGAEHENARDSRGKPQRPAVAPQKSRGPSAGITVSAEANVLKIHGAVAVKELADKLGTRPNVVIAELMKLGILASINQSVDA